MAAADAALRAELARDGSLFEGYNTRMAELHERNARELAAIVATVGWPGRTLVGDEAAEAAWRVLQHAIGSPALQRGCLPLLRQAVAVGEVPVAYPPGWRTGSRSRNGGPSATAPSSIGIGRAG